MLAAGRPSAIDLQPVIVVFEDGVALPAREASNLTATYGARPTFTYSHALRGFAATLPSVAINALRVNPKIRSVELDGEALLADTTETPATWGLDRIDQRTLPLNNAYTYAATGSGVQVYVIDSGIKFDHVDFGGRATLGADYVVDGQNGADCNGHGTHVAGTIGGQAYGVAKAVSLISVRTHDCAGNSTWSKIIAAVDFVTGRKQADLNTPMVANMSIQGSPDAATNTAVANSIAAGVNYAVAAGNGALFGGDACNSTPALVPTAMTVGATTSSDARAFYSNYGSCVDWFAPGDNITSDGISSTTATAVKSGTSMAAPATAGVAALYLQDHRNASPQEVRDALFGATTKGNVTSSNSTNNHLLYSLFAAAPPVLTTITVAPAGASVQTGTTQQFSATGLDQSSAPMSPQPTFTWSVNGGGTVNASGLFTAGATAGGPFTVTATSGTVSGGASVSVIAPVTTTTSYAYPTGFAAVTNGAGDNNGYETSPANLLVKDGAFATDINSGTGGSLTCTSTVRDQEDTYSYGLGLPSSASVLGIMVQITGKVSSSKSSPKFCVLLSRDGGTSWTTGKVTPALSTSNATHTLGTTSDTWGRSWAAGDFGTSFRLRIVDLSNSTSRTFSVDAIAVSVTYQ